MASDTIARITSMRRTAAFTRMLLAEHGRHLQQARRGDSRLCAESQRAIEESRGLLASVPAESALIGSPSRSNKATATDIANDRPAAVDTHDKRTAGLPEAERSNVQPKRKHPPRWRGHRPPSVRGK